MEGTGLKKKDLLAVDKTRKLQEEHGHDDNVCGTLSWASCNEPVAGGDWVGCAQALLEHGLPRAVPDADDPDRVVIDGRRKRFSDEVREVLLGDAP